MTGSADAVDSPGPALSAESVAGVERCEMYAEACLKEANHLMAQAVRLYQDAGMWRLRARRYGERIDGGES